MFSEEQKKLLRDFGAQCYWHGEATGDYEMEHIDDLLGDLWQKMLAIGWARLQPESDATTTATRAITE